MSFTAKQIEVRITLAEGAFTGGNNVKIIKGLGVDCTIDKPGLPAKNSCKITIFGMPLSDMEQATTLAFRPLKVSPNRVEVYAGDDNDLSLAFAGDITSAWPDFNSAPTIGIKIDAITGYVASVTPSRPTTRQGNVAAADLMKKLASEMGYTFQNNGVSASLSNPALYGSPMEKAQSIARQGGFELIVDDHDLVMQPPNADRGPAPMVWSKETGLFGYPTFTKDGISARGYYAPGLVQGGMVSIKSIVPKTSGDWKITSIKHALQAFYPGAAKWETSVEAAYNARK